MSESSGPADVGSNDQLGPDVTAWVCEYESGEVFVSLAAYPMNDTNVRKAWRLVTLRQRDKQVADAVAAERERLAQVVRDFPHWLGAQAKRELLAAMGIEA